MMIMIKKPVKSWQYLSLSGYSTATPRNLANSKQSEPDWQVRLNSVKTCTKANKYEFGPSGVL